LAANPHFVGWEKPKGEKMKGKGKKEAKRTRRWEEEEEEEEEEGMRGGGGGWEEKVAGGETFFGLRRTAKIASSKEWKQQRLPNNGKTEKPKNTNIYVEMDNGELKIHLN
jgi:hypothetical protein